MLQTSTFKVSSFNSSKTGMGTVFLEIHFPAEFSFNPTRTQMNKLIKGFRITRKLQTCVFQGQSYLALS